MILFRLIINDNDEKAKALHEVLIQGFLMFLTSFTEEAYFLPFFAFVLLAGAVLPAHPSASSCISKLLIIFASGAGAAFMRLIVSW